ncbi:MAG: membrane protein insertion efficiency factor YidD [Planctomycetaceae bacterium]|jgi:putative membrane protein insertion efficiency factor|nr:membrane protein insertion efficiency factor YidD [Planctomycetaceae bacterium]
MTSIILSELIRLKCVEISLPFKLPSYFLIGMVYFYQLCISPFLPKRCRYEPSCSTYMILAIKKYGALRGVIKGIWRICRCNPFGGSGYDPP